MCRGTSHALGDNLAHMMSHNHVDYIEANGVERILVDKGQATAVVWKTARLSRRAIYRVKRQSSGNVYQAGGARESRAEIC